MKDYQKIPECGWPCRLDSEDALGLTIDLNDGSRLVLRSAMGPMEEPRRCYTWYDINGGEIDFFSDGSDDFENWDTVHRKLKEIASKQLC